MNHSWWYCLHFSFLGWRCIFLSAILEACIVLVPERRDKEIVSFHIHSKDWAMLCKVIGQEVHVVGVMFWPIISVCVYWTFVSHLGIELGTSRTEAAHWSTAVIFPSRLNRKILQANNRLKQVKFNLLETYFWHHNINKTTSKLVLK